MSGLTVKAKGAFKIIRPVNSFVAGIAVMLGVITACGTITHIPLQTLWLIPVVILVTAAGNTINDYCDRDIDKINRPKRPIPAGILSPKGALVYSLVLFIAGCLISYLCGLLCLGIAVFNSVLLILYAYKFKSTPLIGNISVAYLSASIFLFGGAFFGVNGLIQNSVIAVMVFCVMLAREILKDAEDIEGDSAGGAKTLPMIIGVKKSGYLSFILALAGVIVSFMPLVSFWGIPYVILIAAADLIILFAAYKGLGHTTAASLIESHATGLLKKGMFAALVILIFSALLL